MKHITFIWLTTLIVGGLLILPLAAQTESLGDYARHVRKEKSTEPPATKTFTNDNLPKDDTLSVVGKPEPAPTARTPVEPAEKTDAKAPASAADQQKANDQWKQKISGQKDQIDLLSRELDVLQREYRLRAAAFYADAGNRLRNAGAWDKEDAQYKQQIADKQKALDAAKKQLDDMQEQARKAGAPSSVRQ
jgi:hypothetical protein